MLKKITLSIFGKGKSQLGLREKIFKKVKEIATTNSSNSLDSNELNIYIEKVARNAYKVIDEDINALKQIGFSEDEIFELTVVAAFSAGATRVELAAKLLD